MSVQHIVMWTFKPSASAEARKQTARPYIKASTGGREMSIEGMQNGLSHVFVVEFASVADRDYYVQHDAVHQAFVQAHLVGPDASIERAIVVDFVPGQFGDAA